MSKDDLHQIANADSPESVTIPKTPSGLAAWALIRFGPWVLGFIAAAVFYFDFKVERLDAVNYQRQTTKDLIGALNNNSLAGAAQATAIKDLAGNVEENTKVLRDLQMQKR